MLLHYYLMQHTRTFYKLTLSALVAVYILILVGGIVRSTGAGMGCPDWPKCFGHWVPPTSVEQLPENYKEIYSDHRDRKNKRFAKYLTAFGLDVTAERIVNDESIKWEADFNAVKTWTEYINRIVGVIIGILIFAVFVYSIRFWNSGRSLTVIAGLTFILVGFQGWIGSVVVSTNLTPWTVTVHMLLALVIVAMLAYLIYHTRQDRYPQYSHSLIFWSVGSMLILLVQILLGTQVRESIDRVAMFVSERSAWVQSLGMEFIIHRSFSWLVLLLNGGLVYNLFKNKTSLTFAVSLMLLVLATSATGAGMAYFSIPAFLQPLHLLLGTVTFGVEFFIVLQASTKTKTVLNLV